MMDRETTACLHVVGDRHDGYGLWAPVVSDVAALTELPAVLEGHLHNDDGTGLHQGVLSFAAATSDPVLILPLNEPAGAAEGTSTPRRRRVLVPTERTRTGRRQIREWIGRAERLGFEVVQIHVLTEATAPSMWEGPGHHAEAWWAEVRRRHQIGTASLSIRSGEPAERILTAAARSDFIILFWQGNPSAGRADTLRRLIGGADQPLLLVPIPSSVGSDHPGPGVGRTGPGGSVDRPRDS